MGNSAVVVLHYDFYDEIGLMSPRLADAMRRTASDHSVNDFGFGRVISWGHTSSWQICAIHGNTGWRISPGFYVPVSAQHAAASMLREYGWKCTPPKGKARE